MKKYLAGFALAAGLVAAACSPSTASPTNTAPAATATSGATTATSLNNPTATTAPATSAATGSPSAGGTRPAGTGTAASGTTTSSTPASGTTPTSGTPSANTTLGTTTGLTQTYRASEGSYSFNYPDGWQLQDTGGAGGIDAVAVFKPGSNQQVSMAILVLPGATLPPGVSTPQQVWEQGLLPFLQSTGANQDLQVVSTDANAKIGGQNAYVVNLTGTQNSVKFRAKGATVIGSNSKIYYVQISAPDSSYNQESATLDAILGSLKFS